MYTELVMDDGQRAGALPNSEPSFAFSQPTWASPAGAKRVRLLRLPHTLEKRSIHIGFGRQS